MSHQVERAAQWMYRGIWGVLTQWFRVPERPPTLPALPGEALQSFRPSADYLRYLMVFFWITMFFVASGIGVLWVAAAFAKAIIGLWLLPLAVLLVIVPGVVGYLAIYLRFDTTWYVLSQRSLRIRSGIWVINEATITFENIQNVSVESGPIERMFGIGNVVVETAGGGSGGKGPHGEKHEDLHRGEIAGVSNAAEIRKLILTRLLHSKSGGLGDEHASAPGGWTPDHITALVEIREAIRGIIVTSESKATPTE